MLIRGRACFSKIPHSALPISFLMLAHSCSLVSIVLFLTCFFNMIVAQKVQVSQNATASIFLFFVAIMLNSIGKTKIILKTKIDNGSLSNLPPSGAILAITIFMDFLGLTVILFFIFVFRYYVLMVFGIHISPNDLHQLILISVAVGAGSGMSEYLKKVQVKFHPIMYGIRSMDNRKPVLYLRSFALEASSSTPAIKLLGRINSLSPQRYIDSGVEIEFFSKQKRRILKISGQHDYNEQLAFFEVLTLIGPYIAIGRPEELATNLNVGPCREFVSNDGWRERVNSLIDESAAILIEVGSTQSVLSEISYVIKNFPLSRVIFLLPECDEEYLIFREKVNPLLSYKLPLPKPDGRILFFDKSRNVITPSRRDYLIESLIPFFEVNKLRFPEKILHNSFALRYKSEEVRKLISTYRISSVTYIDGNPPRK